jgi:hypothetical protein
VIMDQRALCFADGFLDGVELLSKIEAGASFIEHLDDATEMAFGPLQPLDDFRMGFVNVVACHVPKGIPPGGIWQSIQLSQPGEAALPRVVAMSVIVQVFGRRDAETIPTLGQPASEKRQGTKSRGVGHRQCSGCYGDLASA